MINCFRFRFSLPNARAFWREGLEHVQLVAFTFRLYPYQLFLELTSLHQPCTALQSTYAACLIQSTSSTRRMACLFLCIRRIGNRDFPKNCGRLVIKFFFICWEWCSKRVKHLLRVVWISPRGGSGKRGKSFWKIPYRGHTPHVITMFWQQNLSACKAILPNLWFDSVDRLWPRHVHLLCDGNLQ